jgi:uncharacterized protein (DUF302 family)/glutaredoxin
MFELYHRQECPYCARVRTRLEADGVAFKSIPVPKLGSERRKVLELTGGDNAEVPVLVDGKHVVQGSDEILAYLDDRSEEHFGDPSWGLTRKLPGVSYSDAVPLVTAALATEGFGVLTEINIRATLKKKLDVDTPNYVILGACNPPLAHKALMAAPGIGLLLPCNVVVTEEPDGTAVVSAIDPRKMFQVVDVPGLDAVVDEVGGRLRRALAAL